MFIVNGAGSQIAQNFIANETSERIVAISRGASINQENVENYNVTEQETLFELLSDINSDHLRWINFQTIKHEKLLIHLTNEELIESFSVNFFTNFIAMKALIPKMIRSKYGAFIFFDSVLAAMGDKGCAAYTSSKLANTGLRKSAVLEYGRFGITCNTIAVSFVDTPMWEELSSKKRSQLLAGVPGKKMVDFEEINSTIRYLIQNPMLNGSTIRLDGGLVNGF